MLIFVTDSNRSTLSRQESAGKIVRLCAGIYSNDLETDPAMQIRQDLGKVLSHLRPGAVISHKSAALSDYGMSEGEIVMTDPSLAKPYTHELPGLSLRVFPGPGALVGDAPAGNPHGTISIASQTRAALENLEPSRTSATSKKKTLEKEDLKDFLKGFLASPEATQLLLATAEKINQEASGHWDRSRSSLKLMVVKATPAPKIHRGPQVDHYRVELFEQLATELARGIHGNETLWGPQLQDFPARPAVNDNRFLNLAFFESYFSNYIEGTQFGEDEARELVDSDLVTGHRPKDSHDIRSLYRLYSRPEEFLRPEHSANDFIDNLKHWHAIFMGHESKEDLLPGQFKNKANRAGLNYFVEPHLVENTLRRAWDIGRSIKEPIDQAIYRAASTVMVHPFMDGNGRITRLSASSMLGQHNKLRFMIPTVFRDDYITAMDAFAHGEIVPIIRTLKRATEMTAEVPWDKSWEEVRQFLRDNSAFCNAAASRWGLPPPDPSAQVDTSGLPRIKI